MVTLNLWAATYYNDNWNSVIEGENEVDLDDLSLGFWRVIWGEDHGLVHPRCPRSGYLPSKDKLCCSNSATSICFSYHRVLLVHCAYEIYRSRRHPYNKPTWVLRLCPPLSVFMIAPPILNPTFSLILLLGKNGFKRRTPGCVFERQRHKRIIKVSGPHDLFAYLGR